MDDARLWRLLEVGRSLMTELEPEAVLDRLLEVAQGLTGARYEDLERLIPAAAGIALIAFVETVAIGRTFA